MKNISKTILKNLKKATSVFIALLMLLSLSSAAFADNEEKTETALPENETEVITENDEPDTPEEPQIEKKSYSYYLKEELGHDFYLLSGIVTGPISLVTLSIVFIGGMVILPISLPASVVVGAGFSAYGLLRTLVTPLIALVEFNNQTGSQY